MPSDFCAKRESSRVEMEGAMCYNGTNEVSAMLKQLHYFQSVVRLNSFSAAAEENYISQSAISQQVQALERNLGFPLLERKNRTFTLTPAGEYIYRKSLLLTADYERMCSEAAKIAHGEQAALRVGYLRSYTDSQFHRALAQFSEQHPDVAVSIAYGNHEELYDLLRTGQVDLILNDQRRAFSDEYVNCILTTCGSFIELSDRASIQALIAEGQKHGTIKMLVNTAGVSPSQAPIEGILQVDLYGTAVLLEEVGKVIAPGGVGGTISSQSGWRMPALTAQQDKLLATASTEELLGLDFLQPERIHDTLHAYQLSKRGNEKRVMAQAVEWGKRGARLNAIAPGIIVTPLALDEFNGPRGDFYKNMFAKCPAGRPGTADEVANVAELLMTDSSPVPPS